VIRAVAFCPHPPLLVPTVAVGAAAELDRVRRECTRAIRTSCAGGPTPVLLGGGPASGLYTGPARGTLAGYGVGLDVELGRPADCAAGPQLPLSLTVGAWLVAQALGPDSGALACSVGPDFAGGPAQDARGEHVGGTAVALVVLAAGSAGRSTTAPGYLDERAAGFDAAVAAALRGGDPEALGALDAQLGAELLAGGVPAWHAAGAVLAGQRYTADLRYDDAPYGVGYFVATWRAGSSAAAAAP
jgi:hypothetical protein